MRDGVAARASKDFREALGVFARFPEPGRAKTRLIPALGPQGAAELHDQLVRHTLDTVSTLLGVRTVTPQIWTAGRQPRAFADHFDTRLPCVAQCDGDLGQRMLAAFRDMLRESSAAVIIGTDCPDLSAEVLFEAFEALHTADVVLGPARDGGYYLIGLQRPAPALFENVEWSTSTVLSTTLERASALGLSTRLLPMLSDVDEPEDLAVWERVKASMVPTGDTPNLSVVVPTLNEQRQIGAVIDAVRRPGIEVVVADGGSDDDTQALAHAHGARVIVAPRGRGPQLNAGAALARGRHLLFLHADTTLPDGFDAFVRETLGDPKVALGAFRFKLDRHELRYRLLERAVHLRCKVLRLPYGDQGLFLRRDVFERLRGFASIPLMEDVDLVRRARRLGRIAVVDAPAVTSARRWESAGVLRTTAINQACLLGYWLGVSPPRLASWRDRLSGRSSYDPSATSRAGGAADRAAM